MVKETVKDAPKDVIKDQIILAPTKFRVSKSVKRSGQAEKSESTEEVIEIHKFATTPAIVKAGIPLKMTMDYQSLGYEFAIEIPCYKEEIDAAADEASAIVFAKIQSKIPEIQAALMDLAGRTKK